MIVLQSTFVLFSNNEIIIINFINQELHRKELCDDLNKKHLGIGDFVLV